MVRRIDSLRQIASSFDAGRARRFGLGAQAKQQVMEAYSSVSQNLQRQTDQRLAEWVAVIQEARREPFVVPARYEAGPFEVGFTGPRPVTRPEADYPLSLIETESGGNLQAYNDVEGSGGVGHGGRLQFGPDRLKEAAAAGIIPEMTPLEYSRQPLEVQEAVENWHFRDINNYINQNHLDDYIGKEIGGVTITRHGIVAMAHLGGKYGARRFLETSGEYNPADAFKTSLLDYARIHG